MCRYALFSLARSHFTVEATQVERELDRHVIAGKYTHADTHYVHTVVYFACAFNISVLYVCNNIVLLIIALIMM